MLRTRGQLIVFLLVYAGMFLGKIPGLALDRSGVALLGAIALIAGGAVDPADAWLSIDSATIGLLLGLMIVSAQFRMGGFYSKFTAWLAGLAVSPAILRALVSLAAATLSAVLANDIICLAMAPVLIEGCVRRGLNPLPFLLALACSSNIGSATTLIGNPQNMLIGQVLGLSFSGNFLQAVVPTVAALATAWFVIRRSVRGRWNAEISIPPVEPVEFNSWQTSKGVIVMIALRAGFLVGSWPREALALAAGGLLLTSRRMASRRFLGLVDWNLLVPFAGLFVVNHALQRSGMLQQLLVHGRELGAAPRTRPCCSWSPRSSPTSCPASRRRCFCFRWRRDRWMVPDRTKTTGPPRANLDTRGPPRAAPCSSQRPGVDFCGAFACGASCRRGYTVTDFHCDFDTSSKVRQVPPRAARHHHRGRPRTHSRLF